MAFGKHLINILIPIVICVFLLCSCGTPSVEPTPEAVATPEPTASPVALYPVVAVPGDSSLESLDNLVSLTKERPVTVVASGRCRLAAAAFCALNDTRFSFEDSGSADAFVFLPDEVPDGYRAIGTLELAIWSPSTPEQEDLYSRLEEELKYYLT